MKAVSRIFLAAGLLHRSRVIQTFWSPLHRVSFRLSGGILHFDERKTRDHYVSHSTLQLQSFQWCRVELNTAWVLEVQALIEEKIRASPDSSLNQFWLKKKKGFWLCCFARDSKDI